jgi:hypothetical protein
MQTSVIPPEEYSVKVLLLLALLFLVFITKSVPARWV